MTDHQIEDKYCQVLLDLGYTEYPAPFNRERCRSFEGPKVSTIDCAENERPPSFHVELWAEYKNSFECIITGVSVVFKIFGCAKEDENWLSCKLHCIPYEKLEEELPKSIKTLEMIWEAYIKGQNG